MSIHNLFPIGEDLFLLQIGQNSDNFEAKIIGILEAKIEIEDFRIFEEETIL